MGCSGCTIGVSGTPHGCRSHGSCSTGGCNRLNTLDWLSFVPAYDTTYNRYVEVSFKNGSHKEFYKNTNHLLFDKHDMLVVESTTSGYDIGEVSLIGESALLQMKKKRVSIDSPDLKTIVRLANDIDLRKLDEVRKKEKEIMVRARAISRSMNLEMKIGDVEFQGDGRKATFYYTADGRVDFRELIKSFAGEFKVKIEMRQIGARQEAGRVGGIGSCGRELCCSTWLTDFKSVSTTAARYQNLAINQAKLSGQCGRLKCCLNYELDTYMEALKDFPEHADRLQLKKGTAYLQKTDIFKKIMWYTFAESSVFHPLAPKRVIEILELNKNNVFPDDIGAMIPDVKLKEKEPVIEYTDVVGHTVLENKGNSKNKNRNKKRRNKSRNKPGGNKPQA